MPGASPPVSLHVLVCASAVAISAACELVAPLDPLNQSSIGNGGASAGAGGATGQAGLAGLGGGVVFPGAGGAAGQVGVAGLGGTGAAAAGGGGCDFDADFETAAPVPELDSGT